VSNCELIKYIYNWYLNCKKTKMKFVGKIENTFRACSVFLHTFVYSFTLHCCLASRSAKALTGNAYQSASSVVLVTTGTWVIHFEFPDMIPSWVGLGWKHVYLESIPGKEGQKTWRKTQASWGSWLTPAHQTGNLRLLLQAIACDVGHKCCVVCVL